MTTRIHDIPPGTTINGIPATREHVLHDAHRPTTVTLRRGKHSKTITNNPSVRQTHGSADIDGAVITPWDGLVRIPFGNFHLQIANE
ncbi:MAG TPA: hypothetical protein VLB73_00140 [Patescibacteria group bacterium]|jgi:hypothetical protein|nr:hypothetical protein [Patescibacteria group bacterium]